MNKTLCVVGARPNFVKMAPVFLALKSRELPVSLIHTGQHYDEGMSRVFFEELGMPQPDFDLEIGSGSHASQTARVMMAFEPLCLELDPGLVLAGGDVNSTLAVSLVAAKLGIAVGHIESGLRSFDRTMPEEINRILTDHLSDLLFTTEKSGNENLSREGIEPSKVHFVGNTMIDSLLAHEAKGVALEPWVEWGLREHRFGVVTLHRPGNVDDRNSLEHILETLIQIAERLPLVFPVHPRTRQMLQDSEMSFPDSLVLVDPLPYLGFLGLISRASVVLTDSGGIQEETTALGTPCLTLRENTERPVTLSLGTNRLVGTSRVQILAGLDEILAGRWPAGARPPLWDGRSSGRIADTIVAWLGS